MSAATETKYPERWMVTYRHDDRGRVERMLGDPGPGRSYEDQAETFFDELRADPKAHDAAVTREYVAVVHWHVRYLDQIRGWRDETVGDEERATRRVEELRLDRLVSNISVRSQPIWKTERRRVLDSTGRAI